MSFVSSFIFKVLNPIDFCSSIKNKSMSFFAFIFLLKLLQLEVMKVIQNMMVSNFVALISCKILEFS